jgi:hypothetical protein
VPVSPATPIPKSLPFGDIKTIPYKNFVIPVPAVGLLSRAAGGHPPPRLHQCCAVPAFTFIRVRLCESVFDYTSPNYIDDSRAVAYNGAKAARPVRSLPPARLLAAGVCDAGGTTGPTAWVIGRL